ncbi:MAG: hypothetical protein V4504_01110 [Patescibacteria group bacterium]
MEEHNAKQKKDEVIGGYVLGFLVTIIVTIILKVYFFHGAIGLMISIIVGGIVGNRAFYLISGTKKQKVKKDKVDWFGHL